MFGLFVLWARKRVATQALCIAFDDKEVAAGVMDLHPRIKYSICEPTNLSEGKDGLIADSRGSLRLRQRSLTPNALYPSGSSSILGRAAK
jgi:hypothetical protein